MNRTSTFRPLHAAPLAVAVIVASCVAVPETQTGAVREKHAEGLQSETLYSVAPAARLVAPTGRIGGDWVEFDLSLWKDPRFQKRFTESYLPETEIEPPFTQEEQVHLQQVMQFMNEERVDKALGVLQKHGGSGASAVFDFMLGSLYFQQDELFQAASAYKDAVAKHAKFRRAWRNLGLVHVRREDFEEAAAAFARVIELGGSDAVTFGLLGYAYSNLGEHMSAESAYRMALLLDPATPDWSMGLARSFFEQRRYAEAATLCGNLLEKEPERVDLWLLQANAFIGAGQPRRAAENFEIVTELGHATFDTLTTLGDIYVNEQLFDAGVSSYLRALELEPDGDVARSLRATKILSYRGAHAECERLVRGIRTIPDLQLGEEARKELLRTEARLAGTRGATEEEAALLEELIALDPLDGDALVALGQHLGRNGEVERAIFLFERAEGLDAFEADACLRHAQLLVAEGRFSEAIPLLRRSLAARPKESVQQYLTQVERAAQAR